MPRTAALSVLLLAVPLLAGCSAPGPAPTVTVTASPSVPAAAGEAETLRLDLRATCAMLGAAETVATDARGRRGATRAALRHALHLVLEDVRAGTPPQEVAEQVAVLADADEADLVPAGEEVAAAQRRLSTVCQAAGTPVSIFAEGG